MLVIYNREELEKAMFDFHLSTGANISLLDKDINCVCGSSHIGTEFCRLINSTEEGKKRCFKSDCDITSKCEKSKKLAIHTCHAGLMDSAVPITYGDNVVAFIILGQMKKDKDFEEIRHLTADLNIKEKELEEAYQNMPLYDAEKIESVASIASYLTEYIILKDIIYNQNSGILNEAYIYINSNLDKPISINKICKSIGVSKNALYSAFKKYESCTVGEYIAKKRVDYAKSLIKFGNKSMLEISELAGFSSDAYFCKIFKKYVGLTPLKYKKSLED